jgi:hypothetical protein
MCYLVFDMIKDLSKLELTGKTIKVSLENQQNSRNSEHLNQRHTVLMGNIKSKILTSLASFFKRTSSNDSSFQTYSIFRAIISSDIYYFYQMCV